jgi:hypothetical protein
MTWADFAASSIKGPRVEYLGDQNEMKALASMIVRPLIVGLVGKASAGDGIITGETTLRLARGMIGAQASVSASTFKH